MTELDDFRTKIIDLGLATSGEVFKTHSPTSPDSCVVLIPTGGLPSEDAFGGVVCFFNPRIKVICRGGKTDAEAPLDRLQLIHNSFNNKGYTINSRVYYFKAIFPPQQLGVDQNDRPRFTCDFQLKVAV